MTLIFRVLVGHKACSWFSVNWITELQFIEGSSLLLITQPMSEFDSLTIVRENQIARMAVWVEREPEESDHFH
jgi:hypothetical protein